MTEPIHFAVTGVNQVTLSWSPPASDGGSPITGYRVYRGTTPGGETAYATVGVQTSYVDSAVSAGTTYYYKVSAINAVGEGPQSNEKFAAVSTVPNAPVLQGATSGNTTVYLSWTAPANGGSAITGYKVYRGTSAGGEAFLASVGNVLAYSDTGLANGTTYFYKVSAVNSAGESAQSNELSATPRAPATVPGAPTLNTVT